MMHAQGVEPNTTGRRPRLSEAERRRIWNGPGQPIDRETPNPGDVAIAGRRFLTRVQQAPDWSRTLRSR
jgi:hypothetical protein